ncbi:cysteine peptidase family C39 domain-containing protein [Staphylococcus pseudintermedius]
MKFSKRFYRAQVDSQDCGAAALTMILEFYGSHYSFSLFFGFSEKKVKNNSKWHYSIWFGSGSR